MITKLTLENFRGIAGAELEIAPITIVTGANNSGKSSLMYGLLAFKNIITSPNQPLDSFFNFLFMNLGGFKESVFLKEEDSRRIVLTVECAGRVSQSTYRASLGKSQSTLSLEVLRPIPFKVAVNVTFPYALSAAGAATLPEEAGGAKITWNGASVTAAAAEGTEAQDPEKVKQMLATLVSSGALPIADAKGIDFVPLKRGFTKPLFTPVPLQAQLLTEDEIATYIANDRDLEAAVNFYLEKIVDKNFQARPLLGAANFYLQTIDRSTGFLCDLVNDGFGTNELVYLLAKALRKDQRLICIEEPEIHVHPGALVRLMRVLVDVAKNRNRRFVISTHSEHLVVELLNSVAKGVMSPDEVRLYYVTRDGAKTVVERQQVNEKGQVEGGLKSFYETELQQIRDFINVPQER